jgi:hypothetical protein
MQPHDNTAFADFQGKTEAGRAISTGCGRPTAGGLFEDKWMLRGLAFCIMRDTGMRRAKKLKEEGEPKCGKRQ